MDSIADMVAGCPEAFREVRISRAYGYARAYNPSPGDDWYSQKRYLGCAEDHRVRANPGGDWPDRAAFATLCAAIAARSIRQLCYSVSPFNGRSTF